jgi:hypothetical protein
MFHALIGEEKTRHHPIRPDLPEGRSGLSSSSAINGTGTNRFFIGYAFCDHTRPWITHVSIQNGSAVEEPARAQLYRDPYSKPIVYDEVKYEDDIASRWGQLTAAEVVFRFWNATVAGTYCGHGKTYKSNDQILWWSKGRVLKGQSSPRLADGKVCVMPVSERLHVQNSWFPGSIGRD